MPQNPEYNAGMKTGRPSNRPRPPFGERLYALREEAGLSQTQVAAKLGISYRAYAFWERRPTAVRPEQLAVLADLYHVSADFMIGRKAAKPRPPRPTGKMRQLFERASNLSWRQQKRIIDVVDALLVTRGAKSHRNGNDP